MGPTVTWGSGKLWLLVAKLTSSEPSTTVFFLLSFINFSASLSTSLFHFLFVGKKLNTLGITSGEGILEIMMDPKNPDDDLKNALLLRKLTTSLTDPYIKPLTTKAGYTAAPTAIKLQWLQSLALVDGESSIIDSLSKATMTWAKAHNKLKLLPPLESHHHHHHHHHHHNNNNNHNTNNHHKQKQTIVNSILTGVVKIFAQTPNLRFRIMEVSESEQWISRNCYIRNGYIYYLLN